jgi:hypothetical protein
LRWSTRTASSTLDVKAHHAVERRALEGPSVTQIARMGMDLKLIKVGDELGACGYLARSDVASTRAKPVAPELRGSCRQPC